MRKYYSLSAILLLMLLLGNACRKASKEEQTAPISSSALTAFSHLKKYPERTIQIDLKGEAPRSPFNGVAVDAGKVLDEQKLSDPVPGTIGYVNPIRELINWETGSYAWEFESNEHAVYSDYEDQIYPGALIKGNSVESFDFNPVVGYTPKPISVSVSLPAPASLVAANIAVPSLTATTQMVNNVLLNSEFSQSGFSKYNLNIKEFTYYDELKEFFATSKNTNAIFFNSSSTGSTGIKKISKTTGLMAKFIQKNFTVDMDIPKAGQLIDLNVDAGILGAYSPLYVSSVTYGRLGIITVESNASFDELKTAFQKAFGILGIVNGSNTLTQAEINIINGADIKVYLVGGQGAMAVQTMSGYQHFMQYLGGGQTFSAQTPGMPIVFSMRYLSDHKPYKAKFQINYGNIEKVYARIETAWSDKKEPFPPPYRKFYFYNVFLAFYSDAACTKPMKASNVIKFSYNYTTRGGLNRPMSDVYTSPATVIDNVQKGTKILLEQDALMEVVISGSAPPDMPTGTEYQKTYTLLPGNGYTVK
ncbi:thiol-activated cytolysin family protein [Chitinophaga pendula]|uniref:thiol-activated cytolysin family protein n=1 Tax=Chitinophaga TaxID=79328 RepID=UPI000BAEF31B|nr:MULTISPECIES: thiol-activated cytolysin family protein [Chitinophaga]ASZ09804.1 hypothetical protein CK934_01820 [Chitinophaga sp. MD30]UCJ07256.1 thiol-activated cytolysin family protein [Chitinophaga pendula]